MIFNFAMVLCISYLCSQNGALWIAPSISEQTEVARNHVWRVVRLANDWNSMFRQEGLNVVWWKSCSIWWILHLISLMKRSVENHQALTISCNSFCHLEGNQNPKNTYNSTLLGGQQAMTGSLKCIGKNSSLSIKLPLSNVHSGKFSESLLRAEKIKVL